ncbi:MFS transporter [Roseivirga sp.]|uniref:MFS transporter n=1 Tax=Roseivirga sp. TaxID=1964215 RepID=UPI003B8DC17A
MSLNNSINKSRLFTASCMALTVTSMTFAIRAGILGQLGTDFGLTDTQLGFVNSMAFLGFPIATIIGGLIYNTFGPKKLMLVAFISHIIGLVLTIFAGDFWTLLISTFFIGFANGTVEAACNPMIADMNSGNKTTMLNRFHVWFPGGIVIGSLASKFMTDFDLGWQLQIALMLVPTLIYGYLFFGQTFPVNESAENNTSKNIKSLVSPLFLFMVICMTLTATAELGTQQWVERILGNTGASPMLILALVTGLMAVGRFFAGPVIKRFNPAGVLWGSSIIATLAIYLMSSATGGMVYVAAILFAIGVMYFWPTMIGFVGEYVPSTGALGMSLIGGAGMFATSIWQPVIGGWLDAERAVAIDAGMTSEAAELAAGQATLGNIVYFPAILVVLFGLLFLNRKKIEKQRVPQTH